jgi:hypothetical protein
LGAGTFDRAYPPATLAHGRPGQKDNVLSQAALEIMAKSPAEDMVQGISRGKANLLLRLMRRRFDKIHPAIEQRVLMAELDHLDRWGAYPLIALIYRNAVPCFPGAECAGQP